VSVPAQIAILLGLTAKLFDAVPLGKMPDAEGAVVEAAAKIPAQIRARFETADKLSDADRAAIVALVTAALAPFQPTAPAKPPEEAKTAAKDDPKAAAEKP
jgi:F-type H+-transporting ATPase subunit alpha